MCTIKQWCWSETERKPSDEPALEAKARLRHIEACSTAWDVHRRAGRRAALSGGLGRRGAP